MIRIPRLPVVTLALLAACTATAPTTGAPLGPDAAVSGGSYSSGGGITLAADLREDRGQTLVCGLWAQSRAQSVLTRHVEHKVLNSASVHVDGTALVRGLIFMNEVDPAADYTGQPARCIRTDRPWRAGDADIKPMIRIPRQVVRFEIDEQGGFQVTFAQTGPGAGGH